MPKLKNLVCQIQWAETGIPFQEYATCYGDGVVETYIVVPNKPQPFTIHLTSKGFIHEGLAAVVFIDGNYQCNRNRVNLLPPKKGVPRERTEIDFLFRQKEKSMGDGTYMGREWRFDNHNIVSKLPEGVTDSHFEQLGNMEVLVLRCSAKDPGETNASTTSSGAESDIVGGKDDNGESTSTTEDEKEKSDNTDAEPATTVVSKEEEGGLFGGLMGLFDGPSDYGRSPYSLPHHTFGHWDLPRLPPSYAQHDGYGVNHGETSTGHTHWSSQHGPDHAPQRQAHFDSARYPGPTMDNNRPSRFEKRVRFDYGQQEEPPADHSRYSDCYESSDAHESRPYTSPRSSHTRRLSDWPGPQTGWYDEKSHGDNHGDQSRRSHGYSRGGNGYGPQPARHYATAPPPAPTHHPPHPPFPTPAPGQPPYFRHPSSAFPPTWVPPQHAQPWPPYPAFGMPHIPPPGYFPHPPYAPMAFVTNPAVGNSNSQTNGGGQGETATDQKPGGLDPAKEENNTKDDGWGNTNSGHNDNTVNAGGDGWDKDDNNNSQNDSTNWANTQNQNNDTSWENNDNQGSDNNSWESNNNLGSSNNCRENTAPQQQKTSDWGPGNQESNTQIDRSKGPSNATSDDTQPSACSGVRPLYGPYGAYYAMQSSATDIACDAEEEPPYDVPQSFVDDYGSSKQVQPGRGYLYCKKQCRPEYVDELAEPYARFVFKYRTKEEMRKEVDVEIDVEPSGNEEVQAFQKMAKDELIQMLLRAKGALGGKIPSPPPQATGTTEETSLKPVVIDPPANDFLDYELPSKRGGNGNGVSGGGAGSGGGSNGDWPTTPANNVISTNDAAWSSTSHNNSNNNNASNNKSWDASGDGRGNNPGNNKSGNQNTTNNTSNNNWGGGNPNWKDGANDTPWTASTSLADRPDSIADSKNEFPEEAWEQARLQQQRCPPPPPPSRDSGISPKTKPEETNASGSSRAEQASPECHSDLPPPDAGYGYHQPGMSGGWEYGYPYHAYAYPPAQFAGNPGTIPPPVSLKEPWDSQQTGEWS